MALTEALADLRALGDLARPASDALALIRGRFDGLTVGGDRARPGHLHVTTLADAGHAGRPHTFVIGLEEGGVFPAAGGGPGAARRRAQGHRSGPAHVGGSRGRSALPHRLAAGQPGRPRLPELLVSRSAAGARHVPLVGAAAGGARAEARARAGPTTVWWTSWASPSPRCPAEPDHALSDAGWWLAGLRRADASALPAVREGFPALAQGAVAEAARESDVFTAYDGLVPEAGPILDPRASGAVVSPTSLEDLAKCPFRYFLQRGLGLDTVDDAEPNPDVWLDPLTRGSIMHDLYATIMREIRDRQETPDPARHGARLRELGLAALAAHRALVPPPSEESMSARSASC